MRDVPEQVYAAYAVLKRDVLVFLSYRARLVTTLFSLFFTLTLFHFLSRLVRVSSFPTPDDYYAYAVVGLIILQVLTSTLSVPQGSLRQELVAGTYERFVLSPFGAVKATLSTLLFPLLWALAAGIAMLAFAQLAFGVKLQWNTIPLVIPLGLLGALSFAPFGIFFLALAVMTRQALAGANYVIAGISLIAGLYFPVSLLPDWAQWITQVQPFTPAVDLMRYVMVGTHLHQVWWFEVLKLVGFSLVLLPLSIQALRFAIHFSLRRGTVLEY